jgi:two-component system LytT family sensor kinase
MELLKPILKYKLHHLFAWAILFYGWYFFRVQDFPNTTIALKITAVKIIALAILVYTTNYLLIPLFLHRKRYISFTLIYISLIFLIGVLKIYVNEKLLSPFFHGIDVFSDFRERIYDNIIPLFLLTSTGAAMKLVSDYMQTQRRLAAISQEKAETELKFLKAQINPHFLFNSLNSIYFLIDKQNTEARQTLLQFSDLLRYQLYECNAESITIEKEIAYLKDYVRLQQLRKDSNYVVDMQLNGINGFQIAPLLLMPFVENAFKHISHYSDRKNFVHLQMKKTNGSFYFMVENSKEEGQRSTEPTGGIGLANVQRRLELLYPDKFKVDLNNKKEIFKVDLELKIG